VFAAEKNFAPSTNKQKYPLNLGQRLLAAAKKLRIRKRSLIFNGVGLRPHAFFVCDIINAQSLSETTSRKGRQWEPLSRTS
jgi:hypothetical protein